MTEQQRNDLLDGATVRTTHSRLYRGTRLVMSWRTAENLGLGAPLPRGGLTTVTVTLPDGHLFYGAAKCSKRDNYCKAIGRQIALGRALKLANTPPVIVRAPFEPEEVV